MKKNNIYQIIDSFRITRRGIVLAGNIVKGIVRIGDWIEFNLNGSIIKRKITAIEGIRSLKEEINCGLIIESLSATEIEELNNLYPNGLLAKTYSHHEN